MFLSLFRDGSAFGQGDYGMGKAMQDTRDKITPWLVMSGARILDRSPLLRLPGARTVGSMSGTNRGLKGS